MAARVRRRRGQAAGASQAGFQIGAVEGGAVVEVEMAAVLGRVTSRRPKHKGPGAREHRGSGSGHEGNCSTSCLGYPPGLRRLDQCRCGEQQHQHRQKADRTHDPCRTSSIRPRRSPSRVPSSGLPFVGKRPARGCAGRKGVTPSDRASPCPRRRSSPHRARLWAVDHARRAYWHARQAAADRLGLLREDARQDVGGHVTAHRVAIDQRSVAALLADRDARAW